MAAHGQHQGQRANLRLLSLYETDYSEDFQTEYRGVTLQKTSEDTWQITDDHGTLTKIDTTDLDARTWIDRVNGVAKHRTSYLKLTEGQQ